MDKKVHHHELIRARLRRYDLTARYDELLRRTTKQVVLKNREQNKALTDDGTIDYVAGLAAGKLKLNKNVKDRLIEWATKDKGGWLSREEKREIRDQVLHDNAQAKKADVWAAIKAAKAKKKVSDVWLFEGLRRAHVNLAQAEQKPAEQKPAEQKPAEQKPAEQKPAEQKPAEQKPAEQKTAVTATTSPAATAASTPPAKSIPTPTLASSPTPTPIATPAAAASPSPAATVAPAPAPLDLNKPLSPKSRESLRAQLAGYNKDNPAVKPEAIDEALKAMELNIDRRAIAKADANGNGIDWYFLNLGRDGQGHYVHTLITRPMRIGRWLGRFDKEFIEQADGSIVRAGSYAKVALNRDGFQYILTDIQQIRERAQLSPPVSLTAEQRSELKMNMDKAVALLKRDKKIGVIACHWDRSQTRPPYLGSDLDSDFFFEVREMGGKKYLERKPPKSGEYVNSSSFYNVEGEGIYDHPIDLNEPKITAAVNIDDLQTQLTELLNQPEAKAAAPNKTRKK
jgi:hypothetical protein